MEISTGEGTLAVLCTGKVTIVGFASAEHHKICYISTYRLNGLRKGMSTPLTLL